MKLAVHNQTLSWLLLKVKMAVAIIQFIYCAVITFPEALRLMRIYRDTESLAYQQGLSMAMLREAKKLQATDLIEFCEAWYNAKLQGEPFHDN